MEILLGFKDTFNDLLIDKELTVKEFSKQLCTLPSVVSEWKNNPVNHKMKTVLKVADYFKCSLEFLCGKTTIYLDYQPQSCPVFKDRIVQVLKECKCSTYALYKYTDIKPSQYHRWRKGAEPWLSSLGILSDYLGVTLDYLIGRDS